MICEKSKGVKTGWKMQQKLDGMLCLRKGRFAKDKQHLSHGYSSKLTTKTL
jgi:hypothetical protein